MSEPVVWDFAKSSGGHYAKPVQAIHGKEMEALRLMFPNGEADAMNFVLFSTSGVHGSYKSILDDYEAWKNNGERGGGVTFLVVHPRLVFLRYGTVKAENEDDFAFLRKLHESSTAAILKVLNINTAPCTATSRT